MDKNNQKSQKKSRFNFAVQGGVSKPMAPGVPSSSSAGRLGFNAGPNNNQKGFHSGTFAQLPSRFALASLSNQQAASQLDQPQQRDLKKIKLDKRGRMIDEQGSVIEINK